MARARLEIVVSNGFHKMHLTTAAREASARDSLGVAITGIYPTAAVKRVVGVLGLAGKGRIARLLERDDAIPVDRLETLFLPEALDEAARLLARAPSIGRLYPRVNVATMHLYGRLAARRLSRAGQASIYHFRAGFGGASIERARELGMVVLCDHALAHPALLGELVANRGRLRHGRVGEPSPVPLPEPADPLARAVLDEIDRSDAVLVNSEFVKDTFLTAGWAPERIHVVYLGVDDNFFAGLDAPAREPGAGRLSLVFASRFERRKGAEIVVEALTLLGDDIDWELLIAGPVTPEILAAHGAFFENDRVRVLGPLTRPDFKRQLLAHPVFVFPSYAEGSARAVFEGLACGCYMITTPNSGTIVEDGVHGALVPPGDAAALADAIVTADRDREQVADIGTRNARLMAERYRQVHYGDALDRVYRRLAGAGSSA